MIMCFLAAINAPKSQASEDPGLSTGQGIGLAIGGLSLGGISYRQFFRNSLGFQVTIGGLPASKYFDTLAGMFLYYKIYEKPSVGRLYLLLGTGAIFESNRNITLIPGTGIGFELALRKNLLLDFNLGIAPFIHANHPQHMLGYLPIPLPGMALIYYL